MWKVTATAKLQDQQSSRIYCQFPTFSGHMCFREKHEKNSHHLHHRTHFLPTVSHVEFKDYVSFSFGERSAVKLGPEQLWGGGGGLGVEVSLWEGSPCSTNYHYAQNASPSPESQFWGSQQSRSGYSLQKVMMKNQKESSFSTVIPERKEIQASWTCKDNEGEKKLAYLVSWSDWNG